MILVDLDKSRMILPTLSMPSLLVNFGQSADVNTTIVNGKVLMRDKEILALDEKYLVSEFRQARTKMLKRAGIT